MASHWQHLPSGRGTKESRHRRPNRAAKWRLSNWLSPDLCSKLLQEILVKTCCIERHLQGVRIFGGRGAGCPNIFPTFAHPLVTMRRTRMDKTGSQQERKKPVRDDSSDVGGCGKLADHCTLAVAIHLASCRQLFLFVYLPDDGRAHPSSIGLLMEASEHGATSTHRIL